MIWPQTFASLVALGALTLLPACSMFGGGESGGAYRQSSAAAPAASSTAAPQTAENTQPPALSPSLIRKVQGNLKQEGLYRGRVDGRWGPMTQHAVVAYQQNHDLNQTGKLDLPTLQAMNEVGGNQYGQENNGGNGTANSGGSMNASAGSNQPGGAPPTYTPGANSNAGPGYQSAGNQGTNTMPAPANQGANGSGTTNPGNGQGAAANTGH